MIVANVPATIAPQNSIYNRTSVEYVEGSITWAINIEDATKSTNGNVAYRQFRS